MTIVTVGIDLAKNVFAVHGVGTSGKPELVKPAVKRQHLLSLIASLPPCLIGMEACSGAHYWAREFTKFGHTVKLIAPKFVAPYRMSGKKGKNDAADAAAIAEAVARPNMRFVPVKTEDQHGQLFIHRARQACVAERVAIINRIRGLLSELGVVMPLSPNTVRKQTARHLEGLPLRCQRVINDLLEDIRRLDDRISAYDREISMMARENENATRLMSLPGIGPTTASAVVATVGNGAELEFKSGRQFSAWCGLTPSQNSSGGKSRLGRITKAGDSYLRHLFLQGARAMLIRAPHRDDPVSRWAMQISERRGYWRAAVALASKNARMCWAMLQKGEAFVMPS